MKEVLYFCRAQGPTWNTHAGTLASEKHCLSLTEHSRFTGHDNYFVCLEDLHLQLVELKFMYYLITPFEIAESEGWVQQKCISAKRTTNFGSMRSF